MGVFKQVLEFVVGGTVSMTISNIITNTTKPNNKFEKLAINVGAAIIGGMVADHATKYVNDQIDETLAEIREVSKQIEDMTSKEEDDYEVR